jgi:ubiquinone/menaquinone biosynthesis C-methylase UbiE
MSQNNDINTASKSQIGDIQYGVKFINPEVLIGQIGIAPGMSVAIFGCGTGYFAISIAKKIMQTGAVYAFDILKQKLEVVESQAKLLGLSNIELRRVNLEGKDGCGLSDAKVDWVIIANMLFQNENKSRIILEAKRVLREGGKILVIEWKENDSSIGPKPELRVPKEMVIKIARKNGLGISKEVEVSDFHYGLILTK